MVFKALRVKLTHGISPLVAFACLSASYFAHIGFFNPYLSLWLKSQGASLYVIGLMASIQSFTRIFAPYGWGWLSDHTGERVWLLRFCASVAVLCSVFMKGASMTLLAGLLLIMFIHTSAMMPMTEAALSHWVSHDGRFDAKRYGRVRLCGSFGFLLTVCLAGFWFERYGLEDFAGWTSLTLLLVNLGAWLIPNTKESVHSHTSQESILRILLKPHNRWFFLTMFFHVLSHMCIYFYLSLYLDQLAYNKTTIGLFWGLGVVVEMAAFYTQSSWIHRLSPMGWLKLCTLGMAVRMALTAWGAGVWPLLVMAQMMHGLTFAVHHTVCMTWLNEHFPAQLRARGQALYSIVGYGLTGVLGGLGGAMLSQHFGLQSTFMVSMGLALLAYLCANRLKAQTALSF